MIKNKNLFKNISILFILIPMLLLSLFIITPKREKINVYADTSSNYWSFTGSNILVPITDYANSNGSANRTMFASINIQFGYGYISNTSFVGPFIQVNGSRPPATINGNSWSVVSFYGCTLPNSFNVDKYKDNWLIVPITSDMSLKTMVYYSSDITPNIYKVTISTEQYDSSFYTFITYYDNNENFVKVGFMCSGSSAIIDGFGLDFRTYYINVNYMNNNSYYQSGYTDGYNDGYNVGTDDGYNEGYDVGNTVGYGNGYNQGLAEGGDYTFLSLMGAVVDAPVSAFTSLLNFEILGFNMLAFFTGLLTLALIIFIVKLILGGK